MEGPSSLWSVRYWNIKKIKMTSRKGEQDDWAFSRNEMNFTTHSFTSCRLVLGDVHCSGNYTWWLVLHDDFYLIWSQRWKSWWNDYHSTGAVMFDTSLKSTTSDSRRQSCWESSYDNVIIETRQTEKTSNNNNEEVSDCGGDGNCQKLRLSSFGQAVDRRGGLAEVEKRSMSVISIWQRERGILSSASVLIKVECHVVTCWRQDGDREKKGKDTEKQQEETSHLRTGKAIKQHTRSWLFLQNRWDQIPCLFRRFIFFFSNCCGLKTIHFTAIFSLCLF